MLPLSSTLKPSKVAFLQDFAVGSEGFDVGSAMGFDVASTQKALTLALMQKDLTLLVLCW